MGTQFNGSAATTNNNRSQFDELGAQPLFDKSSPTFISIIFVLGMLIFAGNAMVCYAYYKVNTLRTLTNKLVISTSVSGIFIGLLFVPFFLVLDEVTRRQITNDAMVPVSSFLASFLGFSLIFNVAALTYERYVAVFHSLRYHCLVTNARVNRVLIVVWMVPFLLSTLPSVLPLVVDNQVDLFVFFKFYQGFLSSVLTLIIVCFFAVYISVWRVSLGHIAFDRRQRLSLASNVLPEVFEEFNNMHEKDRRRFCCPLSINICRRGVIPPSSILFSCISPIFICCFCGYRQRRRHRHKDMCCCCCYCTNTVACSFCGVGAGNCCCVDQEEQNIEIGVTMKMVTIGAETVGVDKNGTFHADNVVTDNEMTGTDGFKESQLDNNNSENHINTNGIYTPERYASNLSITINDGDGDEDLIESPSPLHHQKSFNKKQRRVVSSPSSNKGVHSPRKLSVDWKPREFHLLENGKNNNNKKTKRFRKTSAPPTFCQWMEEASSLLNKHQNDNKNGKRDFKEFESFGCRQNHRRLSDQSSRRRRRRKISVVARDAHTVDIDEVVYQLNQIKSLLSSPKEEKNNAATTSDEEDVFLRNKKKIEKIKMSKIMMSTEDEEVEENEIFTTDNNSFSSSYNSSVFSTTARNSPASVTSCRSIGSNAGVSPSSCGRSQLRSSLKQKCSRSHSAMSSTSPSQTPTTKGKRCQHHRHHKNISSRSSTSPRTMQGSRVSFARCHSTSASALNNNSTRSSIRRKPLSSPHTNNNNNNNSSHPINNKHQIIKGIIKKSSTLTEASDNSNSTNNLNKERTLSDFKGPYPRDSCRSLYYHNHHQKNALSHRPTLHRQAKSMPASTISPSFVDLFLMKNNSFDNYCHRKGSRQWPNPLTPPINYNRRLGSGDGGGGVFDGEGDGKPIRKKSLSTEGFSHSLPSSSIQSTAKSVMEKTVQPSPSTTAPSSCYEQKRQLHQHYTTKQQEQTNVTHQQGSLQTMNQCSDFTRFSATKNNKKSDSVNINPKNNKNTNADKYYEAIKVICGRKDDSFLVSNKAVVCDGGDVTAAMAPRQNNVNKAEAERITSPSLPNNHHSRPDVSLIHRKQPLLDNNNPNNSGKICNGPSSLFNQTCGKRDVTFFKNDNNLCYNNKSLMNCCSCESDSYTGVVGSPNSCSNDIKDNAHCGGDGVTSKNCRPFVSFDNASMEGLSSWSREESPFSSGYVSPALLSKHVSLVVEEEDEILFGGEDDRMIQTTEDSQCSNISTTTATTSTKQQQNVERFRKRPLTAIARRTIFRTYNNNSNNGNRNTDGTEADHVGKSLSRQRLEEQGCTIEHSVQSDGIIDRGTDINSDYIENFNDDDDICPCCRTYEGARNEQPYLLKSSSTSSSHNSSDKDDDYDEDFSPSSIASLTHPVTGAINSVWSRRRISTTSVISRLAKSRNSIISQAKVFLREIKHTRVIAVNVLLNALCWIPLIFLNFADAIGYGQLVTPALVLAAEMAFLLNSLLMPYIYAFCKPDFKRVFLKTLNYYCCSCRKVKKKKKNDSWRNNRT